MLRTFHVHVYHTSFVPILAAMLKPFKRKGNKITVNIDTVKDTEEEASRINAEKFRTIEQELTNILSAEEFKDMPEALRERLGELREVVRDWLQKLRNWYDQNGIPFAHREQSPDINEPPY